MPSRLRDRATASLTPDRRLAAVGAAAAEPPTTLPIIIGLRPKTLDQDVLHTLVARQRRDRHLAFPAGELRGIEGYLNAIDGTGDSDDTRPKPMWDTLKQTRSHDPAATDVWPHAPQTSNGAGLVWSSTTTPFSGIPRVY